MTNPPKKAALKSRLLSLKETCAYLGLSEKTVRNLRDRGELRAVRITRKIQFDLDDLNAFIDARKGVG